MRTAASIGVALLAICCAAALGVSIYPGVLNQGLFFGVLLALVVVPVVGLGAVVCLIVLARRGKLKQIRVPWRQAAAAAAILCLTCALLKFYVPRRIAFAASRSAFEQFVAEAPESDPTGSSAHRLGVYRVIEHAEDPAGGQYLVVYRHPDMVDCVSYGFVYRPNRAGTPFGRAHYELHPLAEDWYWFRVSDDW
ncbi:MAG: hypothetical protein JXB13_21915 [Phycisphaerae bacterium]|nr:hypothetical protein [Phycisphaerae bacterium]